MAEDGEDGDRDDRDQEEQERVLDHRLPVLAIVTVNPGANLTGPITGMHVHGADTSILFDVDAATPQPDGTLIWVFVPVGNFTVADILNQIKAGQTYLNIHTGNFPGGEVRGFLAVVPEPGSFGLFALALGGLLLLGRMRRLV